ISPICDLAYFSNRERTASRLEALVRCTKTYFSYQTSNKSATDMGLSLCSSGANKASAFIGSIFFCISVFLLSSICLASAKESIGYKPMYSRTRFFVVGLVYRIAQSLDPSFLTRKAKPPPSVTSYSALLGFKAFMLLSESLFVAILATLLICL